MNRKDYLPRMALIFETCKDIDSIDKRLFTLIETLRQKFYLREAAMIEKLYVEKKQDKVVRLELYYCTEASYFYNKKKVRNLMQQYIFKKVDNNSVSNGIKV